MNTILNLHRVGKTFNGVQALLDCSADVERGTITGIIGPNGAGKTTLFNLIAGWLVPTKGEIWFEGRRIDGIAAHHIWNRRIGRTFQIATRTPRISVIEALLSGSRHRRGEMFWMSLFDYGKTSHDLDKSIEMAEQLLQDFGLISLKNRSVAQLSAGQRKLVSILQVLMSHPKLLLLDEPTAGVSPEEIMDLIRHLRAIHEERNRNLEKDTAKKDKSNGFSIIMVEHRLNIIENLCKRVIVLSDGRVIADGTPEEIRGNAIVQKEYLGGESNIFRDTHKYFSNNTYVKLKNNDVDVNNNNVLLDTVNLTASAGGIPVIHNIDLKVYNGQIVAIVGRNGVGKTTLLNSFVDPQRILGGSITFSVRHRRINRPVKLNTLSRKAIFRQGISLVPQTNTVFENLTVMDHLMLTARIVVAGRYGGLSRREKRKKKNSLIDKAFRYFPELSNCTDRLASNLSGGQGQMLNIACGLISEPSLLLLDEPLAGLGPIVVQRISKELLDIRDQGCSIILVEQQAKQALRLADYVYIMESGSIAAHGYPGDIMNRACVAESLE